MMNHTPLPWVADGGCLLQDDEKIEIATFGNMYGDATEQQVIDSEFAAHAVNNHKDLVTELDTLIKRYEAATGFEAISARSALRRAKDEKVY